MRILQISTFFSEHGGVEKAVSDLAHSLSAQHEVLVLCTGHGATSRSTIGNVDVITAGGRLSLSGRPISFSFGRELKNSAPDVAHYHLPCPMAVFSHPFSQPKAKVKVATWHHDLVRHQLFNAAMRPLLRRFLHSLDSIIVTAPQLIEHTPILRDFRDKCHVIPLGIDHTRFEKMDHDDVLDQRNRYGAPLLLHVGRLVYYKGSHVLLDAMRQVPEANLVIVGAGPLQPELEQRIRDFNLQSRVHLVGWQPEGTLRSLYQACDVFILPSTLSTECFGLVQVEAMLCGKPVINTSLPTGVPWVSLHEETGMTVAPSDVDALAEAISAIVKDKETRRTYGENARKRALSMFTLEQHRRATVAHYEQLLAARHQQARTKVPR